MHDPAPSPLRPPAPSIPWRRVLAWTLMFLAFVPCARATTWNAWQEVSGAPGTDIAISTAGSFTYQGNEHLFYLRARNRYVERARITVEFNLEKSTGSRKDIEIFDMKAGATAESSGYHVIALRVTSFRLVKLEFPDRPTNTGGGTGGGTGGNTGGGNTGGGNSGGGTGGNTGGGTDTGRIEFAGNTSWSSSGSKLTISVDQLWNHKSRPSNGPLRLYVMAGPRPYSGGSLDGFRVLGTYTFPDSLPAGYYYQNVNQTVAYTAPPNGTYYTILAVTELVGGTYTVQDYRSSGQKTFGPVILPTPPSIQTQPKGATVNPGASVTFTVKAAGTAPLTYQWRRDGIALPGPTTEVLSLANVSDADAGSYVVTVSNSAGTVASQAAMLVVNRPPSITSQPQGGTVPLGGSITLSVAASGLAPLSYQWRLNNAPLAGKTAASLPLKSITQAQAGDYAVVVSNPAGSVTSLVARVSVNVPFTSLRSTLTNVSWVKPFGGAGDDFVYAVGLDRANATFLTGYFSGAASFGAASFTSQGLQDAFLTKLNPVGDVLWTRTFGGTGYDSGKALAVDADGGVLVAGDFSATVSPSPGLTLASAGGSDLFIAKWSAAGDLLWAKSAGGPSDDTARAVLPDGAGGLYVSGSFQGTARFGNLALSSAGGDDIFVARLDANGNFLWAVRLGGGGTDFPSWTLAPAPAPSGGVYLAGYFQGTATFGASSLTSAGSDDAFVARLNADGSVRWATRAGGTGLDRLFSIASDAAGQVFVAGAMSATADFGTTKLTSAGGFDAAWAKLSLDGKWLWAQRAGGTLDDLARTVSLLPSGELYLAGIFQGTAAFGSTSLTVNGDNDLFLARIKSTGPISSVQMTGGVGLELPYTAALNSQGGLLLGGAFSGSSRFGTYSAESAGASDGFVLRLDGLKASLFRAGSHLRLTAVRDSDGRARLVHVGEPGLAYDLETSTDLEHWTPIHSETAGDIIIPADDTPPAAANSAQFFRAVPRPESSTSGPR